MTAPQQQKLRIAGPVVVTANRLADGAVVYRTAQGDWTPELQRAAVAKTAEHAKELLAPALADGRNAIGAYVAPVVFDDRGRAVPGNLREIIRRQGPSFPLPVAERG